DLHPSSAPVPLLPSPQFGVNLFSDQAETRRHTLECADERGTVRFTGGSKAKHENGGRRSGGGGARGMRALRTRSTRPAPELEVRVTRRQLQRNPRARIGESRN